MRNFELDNEGSVPSGYAIQQWAERHNLYAGPVRQNSCLHELVDPGLRAVRDHDTFTEYGLDDFIEKFEKAAEAAGRWQEPLKEASEQLRQAAGVDEGLEREIALFESLHLSDDVVRQAVEDQESSVLADPMIALDFLKEELVDDPIHNPSVPIEDLEALVRSVDSELDPDLAHNNQEARVVLIARLVHHLRSGMTPKGVLFWFDNPRYQLNESTPRQLIDADVGDAYEPLMELARGGRGQIST